MNLNEFVSETLAQIVTGVRNAQGSPLGSTVINPPLRTGIKTLHEHGRLVAESGAIIQFIEFDIALTASEGTDTKGGIGVVTGIISLGSAGESKSASSSAHRVRFQVPIAFPIKED